MIQLIPALEADCAFVQNCIEELEEQHFNTELFAVKYKTLLASDNYFTFIITYDSQPCGLIGISISSLMHHQLPVAEIQELIIFEAFRNKKIGRRVMTQALAFAREKGCEMLELSSRNRRKEAHRFYENNGLEGTHIKFTYRIKS